MAAALILLLIGSLLQGTLSGQFEASMPKSMEVLSGSCVTIPCSFDVPATHESNLDRTCTAAWLDPEKTVVFNSSNPQQPKNKINGKLMGNLREKDCTTTLNKMQLDFSNKYILRVECNNDMKFSFTHSVVDIMVKDDPRRPTLTRSTLKVKEGASVSLTCSAPAPCPSHPPTLTWAPGLGDIQESLQDNPDKTKVTISIVNFNASYLHHEKTITCTAVYNKQDASTKSSVTTLTADISYSPKDTTVSVHPSGPVPENSSVNLKCSSTANPAVRSYTWYRTHRGQETIIGTGAVLNFKASKDDRLFFCKAENDLGVGRSNLRQIDIQFPPQILSSSDCTKSAVHLNCSCRTVGNPPPTLQWFVDGLPANHSDKFVISNEHLNDTGLRSTITVTQPQERNLATLLCQSSNSLGSASLRFCVRSFETSGKSRDGLMLPVFITTVVTLLGLLCALLFVIRAQKAHHNLQKSQCTGAVIMSQLLTREDRNEVPNTTEEDIHVNTNAVRQADVAHDAIISEPNGNNSPSSGANDAEGAGKSSEKKNEGGSDVIYSSVNWKAKTKKKKEEKSVVVHQPSASYVVEERCTVGGSCRSFVEMGSLYDNVVARNVETEVESEYAEVTFKDKGDMHK